MEIEVINIPDKVDVVKTAAIAKTAYYSEHYEDFKDMAYDKAVSFLERLIKIGHESSIEPLIFTFNITGISRVLTHQLVRHRMASFMQKSFRRHRKLTEKDFVYPSSSNDKEYRKVVKQALAGYKKLVEMGEDPDQARRILPMGIMTEITFTMNARSLRNFLRLRLDRKANYEIRRLAAKIVAILIAEDLAFLIRDILKKFNEEKK